MTTRITTDIKLRWDDLLLKNPRLRIRDASDQLKVSEVELLATGCGEMVSRLEGNWNELLQEFPRLGEVKCLTRNQAAVHERLGTFIPPICFFGQLGQVTGPEIDLRFFMSRWKHGFAVRQAARKEGSFQFFDQHGTAVHKVYLTKHSSLGIYEELREAFCSPEQSQVQQVVPLGKAIIDCPDAEIDIENFHKGWLATTDTHEFHDLLRKFRVGRQQALRLAPKGYVRQVQIAAIEKMLRTVALQRLPVMVFVGSPGCLQIHTGAIRKVRRIDSWLNILDRRFSFHLNEALVASAWIVKKVTKDGPVTSLELFDVAGENLALFFGKRKPGQMEDPSWQAILELL